MLERIPYDRRAAVAYAHQWAYGRNPDFYDYEEIGGDCTNFASQCLYAGTGVMNFDPVYGWFYRDPNDKAPAWTGVEYFFDFITRQPPSPGPFGISSKHVKAAPLSNCGQGSFSGLFEKVQVSEHLNSGEFHPLFYHIPWKTQ